MELCRSPFCAEAREVAAGQVGGRNGDAEAHRVVVRHKDIAGAVRLPTDGKDREATSEERVFRIRYLDLVRLRRGRVVERGINMLARLTLWIMAICERFSDFGCVTVCCCA